jgi:DNA-binding NarL/FixJ family response regulator
VIAAPADLTPPHAPDRPAEDTPPPGWSGTAAEWRVARRVALGHSYSRIAAALGVSFHTAETYVRRMANRPDTPHGPTRRDRVCALVQALTSEP